MIFLQMNIINDFMKRHVNFNIRTRISLNGLELSCVKINLVYNNSGLVLSNFSLRNNFCFVSGHA